MGCRREKEEVRPDRQAQEADSEVYESDGRERVRLRIGHQLGLHRLELGFGIPTRSTEESGKPGPLQVQGARSGSRAVKQQRC